MKIFIVKGHILIEYEADSTWNCKAFYNKENAQKLKNQLNSEAKRLYKKKNEMKNSNYFSFSDECKDELKQFFLETYIEYLEPFFIEELELEE